MKKVLLGLIFMATAFGIFGVTSYAAGTGNLVVHFKAWNEDYTDLGSWAWGDTAAGRIADGTDSFGAYFNFDNIAVGTEVGFIAVYWNPDHLGPNWDRKVTQNVIIPSDVIIAGETVHVYVFEGAETKDGHPAHFVASNAHRNMLVVYYDPSGSYEETLGLHHWGWLQAGPEWASPDQLLTNAGISEAGNIVKATMMQAVEDWAGLLIYAGDDSTKKTGDVTLEASGAVVNGDVGIAYVVSKGNAYTANDNVFYNDYAGFFEAAFEFKLLPFGVDGKTGTYAIDPTTVVVRTSAQIASPYPAAVDEAEQTVAMATITGWFTIKEDLGDGTFGTPLVIEGIDFAQGNTTLNTFVVLLAAGSELDNTKEYVVEFNLGLAENNLTADINLDLDTEAPELTLISPSGIVGQDAENRIIEIAWGEPFNQNSFPRFRVNDNRDGDLTTLVFVPKGDFSVLDTRTEGDYTIMLRVVDLWGNVTEETFIFRVVKPA